jgi:arylsulfatase A-like enzyme
MKAIMVMFDSLNRHMLPPYGCDWVHAPNFARLAEQTVVFDRSFVGSMPCMPARRELHTGRYNFLHRSWGPLEPFDDSAPAIMKEAGIPSHLASDHYHYWEEGGCTYHTRYSTWQCNRGQEGDPWKGMLGDPDIPRPNPGMRERWGHQDWVNRSYMREESLMPQALTMSDGIEFMETNRNEPDWFLQIETFDPHEPYFVPDSYKSLYDHDFSSPFDWPGYEPVGERHELTKQFRFTNAALVSMCDAQLGRILDTMDRLGLWDETMLIVNTDHGFLLGEHDWWGKCRMPFYHEVANTPLFIWDPRCRVRGERRESVVQTIDLPATLLDYFGLPLPESMQGKPLAGTIACDTPVREAALYGIHGGHVNVTDGRYVYMRAPATATNRPLYNYTLMPTHMRLPFSVEEMRTAAMAPPFPFTKGCPVMRIDANPGRWTDAHSFGTLLFDQEADSKQEHPLDDRGIEKRMVELLIEEMRRNDAPKEQYERLGLGGI